MRRWNSGTLTRVALPVRTLVARYGFILLLVAAGALMTLGRADIGAIAQIKAAVTDMAAPALNAMSRPLETVRGLGLELKNLIALRDENARLRSDAARLARWELVARRLERENAALRGLLNYRPDAQGSFVSARVVGDSGSAFVRTLLVNVGASDGIAKGQAVMDGAGLVGRVVEVGRSSARILLITDLNSRIPVLVEDSRQRAILAGDNTNRAYLDHLPENLTVEPGVRIVTSGHGGILPSGLPVGVVDEQSKAGPRVRPLADFRRLEYVRVIRWRRPVFEPLQPTGPAAVAAPDPVAPDPLAPVAIAPIQGAGAEPPAQ